MTKVLLIILYVSIGQGGVTSQFVDDIAECQALAGQIRGRLSLTAFCVGGTK